MQAHLNSLKEKHAALDAQISSRQRSPGANQLKTAELKKRKLALKKIITSLESYN
ncbi:DUF465 domain-containing protein [Roseovarius sp. M141]|uniref:DUF465 domain-containing protein n=1 Tax=Roseovarius sp. M141 TaxID=2583806 RepID=UPI0020CCF98B|nr:DUF465 domain-containing protein [Roseovarius sp. M141]MCQ0093219.1 DUF465 domain-containing protein [Roseovarius sp. M141]